jgi:hypothetical protein
MGSELVTNRFSLTSKVCQSLKVIELPVYFIVEFEGLLKTGASAENFARTFLVGIEVGLCNLLLELFGLTLFARDVKETSALPRYAFLAGRIFR